MANGAGTGYTYEDIADPRQVRNADLNIYPAQTFIPVGRIAGMVDLERVSISELMAYLDRNLELGEKLVQEIETRQLLTSQVSAEIGNREALDRRVESNTGALGDILARLHAHEQGARPGGGTSSTVSYLHFGVMDATGTKLGTEMQAEFTGVPATVSITFPAVDDDNDRWYFEFPQGVVVVHIWEETLGRQDLKSEWPLDGVNRRYMSPPQTAGFQGFYSIAIANA